jgi:hypothetical protein
MEKKFPAAQYLNCDTVDYKWLTRRWLGFTIAFTSPVDV